MSTEIKPQDKQLIEAMIEISGQHIYTVGDMARAAAAMGIRADELLRRAQERIED